MNHSPQFQNLGEKLQDKKGVIQWRRFIKY
jgi:hypothetical protein